MGSACHESVERSGQSILATRVKSSAVALPCLGLTHKTKWDFGVFEARAVYSAVAERNTAGTMNERQLSERTRRTR